MKSNISIAHHIAQALLDMNAITLSSEFTFKWASGIHTPIYCDNRLTMRYPAVRSLIADKMAELITTHFPDCEVIAGTATAGIPHAAWVSERLNLPMIYIRSSAKEHGKCNQIEGGLTGQQKIVIIEDVISTGKSVVNAINTLKQAEQSVLGAVAIFNYQLNVSQKMLNTEHVPYYTLCNYQSLLATALETGRITEKEVQILQQWHEKLNQ